MSLGTILPFAIGVALSPVPIIAVILMLFSARARSNGLAFVLGWVAGLAIVGGGILLLAQAGLVEGGGEPAGWSYWLKLGLGVLFLVLAWRSWQQRPREGEVASMPAWMDGIDDFTPGKSLGLAALLSGLNPKNLALTLSAALAILSSGAEGGQTWLLLLLFIVIASSTVATPVLYYVAAGDSAEARLSGWKAWLAAHNTAVMLVLLLVIGAKLIGDGLGGIL